MPASFDWDIEKNREKEENSGPAHQAGPPQR